MPQRDLHRNVAPKDSAASQPAGIFGSKTLLAFVVVLSVFMGLSVTRTATAEERAGDKAGIKPGTVTIGVAANFLTPLKTLSTTFQDQTGHKVRVIAGSTGKLYGMISQGAPIDIFLAADQARPTLLAEAGLAVKGSQFTYARGQLALWQNTSQDKLSPATPLALGKEKFQLLINEATLEAARPFRFAIANPDLAPYGFAAREMMQNLNLFDKIAPHLVRGQSVGQTFQMIASGNATMGLVAYAQILDKQDQLTGQYWLPPHDLYQPIRQDAVLLKRALANPAARAFMDYLRRDEVQDMILEQGYLRPAPSES